MPLLIEYGSYKKLPHYELIGSRNDFYVWINEDGKGSASKWIKGKVAFTMYNKIKSEKNQNKAIEMIKDLYLKNQP